MHELDDRWLRRGRRRGLSRRGREIVRAWCAECDEHRLVSDLVDAMCVPERRGLRAYLAEDPPRGWEAWARREMGVVRDGGAASLTSLRRILEVGQEPGLYVEGMASVALEGLTPRHGRREFDVTGVLLAASDLADVIPILTRHAHRRGLGSGVSALVLSGHDVRPLLAALPERGFVAARALHAMFFEGAEPNVVAARVSLDGWHEFYCALQFPPDPRLVPRAAAALLAIVADGGPSQASNTLRVLACAAGSEGAIPGLVALLESDAPHADRAVGPLATFAARSPEAHSALERALGSGARAIRHAAAMELARNALARQKHERVATLLGSPDVATRTGAIVMMQVLFSDCSLRIRPTLRRYVERMSLDPDPEVRELAEETRWFWRRRWRWEPEPTAG